MPELPEVETIKLGLQKKIVGLKITKIQINSAKSFIGNPNLVEGKKVLNIWRKAKYLGVDVVPANAGIQLKKSRSELDSRLRGNDNFVTLLFHLKMTGQLIYEDGQRLVGGHPTPDMVGKMPNAHTRIIFSFSDGSHLYFNDQRKFGWVKAVDRGQVTVDSSLKNLGPEPLERGFTWQILKQNLLRHKSMPVKVATMDQTVVSGVGNIYSNEACFSAGLDPRVRVRDLNDEQFKKLYKGIIKSLKDGIKYGGSTRAHFVDAEGHKGYFLDYAYVYGRDKHPCKICGTKIKKIQLGGRGTYLCPNCQKGYNS
ncbi:bifunctional DNA-formamidopyrimidine glycosylase/DNA-(apurinic or apyrimidinic site) lyase [Candidatus Microgenomates bacterium]|nr:bifunctional DNA-formamidopyrimidine glycosylase/DNA-(apurinic or apyrimidinic site) lyase [Candidatus Microgenomates bacterium]